MRVTESEHPAVVLGGFPALDFHQPEVPAAVVGQAVSLGADDEAVGPDGIFHPGDQVDVWNRCPGLRGPGCRDIENVFSLNRLGSTVEQEVGMPGRDRLGF